MKITTKNKNVLYEFIILLLISIILGKGLIGGLFLGAVVMLFKLIYNKFTNVPSKLATPLQSLGLGIMSGFFATLLRLIF